MMEYTDQIQENTCKWNYRINNQAPSKPYKKMISNLEILSTIGINRGNGSYVLIKYESIGICTWF